MRNHFPTSNRINSHFRDAGYVILDLTRARHDENNSVYESILQKNGDCDGVIVDGVI